MKRTVFMALILITIAGCSVPTAAGQAPEYPQPPEGQTHPQQQPPTEQAAPADPVTVGSTVIVDTNQTTCYSTDRVIPCGSAFTGQDAEANGAAPAYQVNGDGTVSDLNTGLMWQQDPGPKVTYAEATANAAGFTLAGYDDWRLPTITELYSLMDFSGVDSGPNASAATLTPFIDASVFGFQYGDESAGERLIDSQWATSTLYQSTVMNGQSCFFGVNFADGRIKCYPTQGGKGYFALYVRGEAYGTTRFIANGDGTLTEQGTGTMWTQADSGTGMPWAEALTYCQNLTTGGYDDWRLPNAKELQYIVDYTRSPDSTNSAALDALFQLTPITNEAGQTDYAHYWSSTTHVGYPDRVDNAVYIALGRALGNMGSGWVDVHGAGAQRSDPKAGVPADQQNGFGPQGDARRSDNMVLCVRG